MLDKLMNHPSVQIIYFLAVLTLAAIVPFIIFSSEAFDLECDRLCLGPSTENRSPKKPSHKKIIPHSNPLFRS